MRQALYDLRAGRAAPAAGHQEERLAGRFRPRETGVASLWLALRKRPVSVEAVEAAIARIEEKLLALGEREVASEKIGEMVMRELKKLDKVAYVRFASVYRNFEDVDEFSKVIREVSRSSPPLGR